MLRVTGHPAALLDGGFQAYDGPPEQTTAQAEQAAPPARFTPRPWPDGRLASIGDATDPAHVVLDARDRARYRGDTEPVDPRPGHIPGARSLPCRENLAADGTFPGSWSQYSHTSRLAALGDTPLFHQPSGLCGRAGGAASRSPGRLLP